MRRDAGIGEKLLCQTFMSFLAGQGRNKKREKGNELYGVCVCACTGLVILERAKCPHLYSEI